MKSTSILETGLDNFNRYIIVVLFKGMMFTYVGNDKSVGLLLADQFFSSIEEDNECTFIDAVIDFQKSDNLREAQAHMDYDFSILADRKNAKATTKFGTCEMNHIY
jgi:hypothetical protein